MARGQGDLGNGRPRAGAEHARQHRREAPREWRRRRPYRWLRQILPDPKYAPGYLNEFGGHFQITQEMRENAAKMQQRIKDRA